VKQNFLRVEKRLIIYAEPTNKFLSKDGHYVQSWTLKWEKVALSCVSFHCWMVANCADVEGIFLKARVTKHFVARSFPTRVSKGAMVPVVRRSISLLISEQLTVKRKIPGLKTAWSKKELSFERDSSFHGSGANWHALKKS
jgi:hypothetical protein